MPRYQQGKELHTVTITDNQAGDDVVFTYREPTPKERQAYDNESIKRKGRKVKFLHFSARLKFGLMLIEGVSDGYLDRGSRKKPKPISSDPDSKLYDPNWKAVLKEVAPEIVVLFGAYVYDGQGEVSDEDEDDPASPDGYAAASPADAVEEIDPTDPEKNLSGISGL